MAGSRSATVRWWAQLAVLLVIMAACFAIVVRDVEPSQAIRAAAGVDGRWMALAVLVTALQVGIRALRVHCILSPATRPSFGVQVTVTAVGFMAINLLPLRLGEFVRPWLLSRRGVSLAESSQAIVIERTFDLIALLAMLLFVAFVVDLPPSGLVVAGIDVVAVASHSVGILVVLLLAALLTVLAGGAHLARGLSRLPALGPRIGPFVETMSLALRGLARSPLRLTGAASLSAAVWLASATIVWAVMHAFALERSTFVIAITTSAATAAGILALPTPGFFGPFEMSAKASLSLFGNDPSTASAVAITWHMLLFGFTIVCGLVFTVIAGISLRDALAQRRGAEP